MLNRPYGGLNVAVKQESPVPDEPAKMDWPFPTVTELEMRSFKRLFGIESPSLIHNGKKRRKS